MSPKVWAVIAAVIVVLALAVTQLSKSGSDYKSTVTEYECNVQITGNPEAFQKQVLGTVTFSCKTSPKTTDLVLYLQHKDAKGAWQDAATPKEFTSNPTSTAAIPINISAPCSSGDWQVGYDFSGEGAATGKRFDNPKKFSSTVTLSADQCANS